MPALNEEAHIRRAIKSLLPSPEHYPCELIVVDGGSTDATCLIIEALARKDPRIRLIHNPRRLQAAGVNHAAKQANPISEILIRADCHAEYPVHFVDLVCRPILEGRAASVVVPMVSRGQTFIQSGIAIAQNARLGNGGAPHRSARTSHFVDHGHHAAILKSAYSQIGGYREDMIANEDAEFDLRLKKIGQKIWLCQEAQITYFPRKTFAALARQYFRYGEGRARTCILHRIWPRIRQIAPVLIASTITMAFIGSGIEPFLVLLPLGYLFLCQAYAIGLTLRLRQSSALLAGCAALVMHMSWGFGFLSESFRELIKLRR